MRVHRIAFNTALLGCLAPVAAGAQDRGWSALGSSQGRQVSVLLAVNCRAAASERPQRARPSSASAGSSGSTSSRLDGCDWHVDLVLTDILMPVLRGDALARRIQALRPELPVLCMSGHLDDALAAPGEPWTGDRLIAKPCTAEVLLGRVAAALALPVAQQPP